MIHPATVEALLSLTQAVADVDGLVPCRDDDRWYAEDRKTRQHAADLCLDCPVLQACSTYADAADERWGVWAGLDRTRPAGTKKKEAA